jgi:hypothetical protein
MLKSVISSVRDYNQRLVVNESKIKSHAGLHIIVSISTVMYGFASFLRDTLDLYHSAGNLWDRP